MTAPVLVLCIGNPSRGDDALGPRFLELAARALATRVEAGEVELLADYQLQVEHALDLAGRDRVFFVDASLRARAPFEYLPVRPDIDRSYTTHAMSPGALLAVYRRTVGAPPEAWLLAIRGETFDLGDPLSAAAAGNLEAAVAFLCGALGAPALAHGTGLRLEVSGTVQGVGFRPWVYRTAVELGLRGEVYNTPRGVQIEAFGAPERLDALARAVLREPPRASRVGTLAAQGLLTPGPEAFSIVASGGSGAPVLALPADLAACDACLAEVDDPADRRHRYPMVSCTECGPRFSITEEVPFDRPRTTMAAFPLCADCAREYESPSDRRFHAQVTACPRCGPRVWLAGPDGRPLVVEGAVEEAARRLLAGEILAVQGLGAFHLVADATSEAVVGELRRRKRRELRPLAVMAPDLASAESLAELDDEARAALTSRVRPIVLATARPGGLGAAVLGPSARAGLMLPYTPLHHLLLGAVRRPLVMTSGNTAGQPAVIAHDEAFRVLGPLASAFLLHDRRIVRRVEDSVVAVGPGGPRVLRRSRGLAPRVISLRTRAPEPVLAVGGHLKNTVCVVIDDRAYVGPHLGDLESLDGELAWRADLEAFERLLGVRAEVVAHDLHPDYATTRWAVRRAPRVLHGVQHHAAHVFSAIAELGVEGPVLGLAFDGSGFGTDGTSWGGELLAVEGASWRRLASFAPLPLPGGEVAVREVWRQALSALSLAFGAETLAVAAKLPVFAGIPRASLVTLLRMIEARVSCPGARGVGRAFDAAGALLLGTPRAGFEGHVAIALEELAEAGEVEPYPVELPRSIAERDRPLTSSEEVGLAPTYRALVEDTLAGRSAAQIAARFHETITTAAATMVEQARAATGIERVVLTGGSFQNRWLERRLTRVLGEERVLLPRELPVNDGGLALGQAWSAILASCY